MIGVDFCVEVFLKAGFWEMGTSKRFRQCNIWSKKAAVVNGFALLPGMDAYECVFQPDKSDGRKFLFLKGTILRCLLY